MSIHLSIVTVHFNDMPGLVKTAMSVSSLSGRNEVSCEWVVVDGGTDFSECKAQLDFVKASSDVFVSGKDKGIYDAMNIGVTLSKGNYLIFMNAGDVFADEFSVENLLPIFLLGQASMIWGASYECEAGERPKLKQSRGSDSLWYGMPTHHQAMFFRRDILGLNPYDLEYKVGADYGLVCAIAKNGRESIEVVNVPVCVFELGGLSTRRFREGLIDQWRIRQRWLGSSKYREAMMFVLKMFNRHLRNAFPSLYRKFRYVD